MPVSNCSSLWEVKVGRFVFSAKNFKGHEIPHGNFRILGLPNVPHPRKNHNNQDFHGETSYRKPVFDLFFLRWKLSLFFCNVRPPWHRCRYRWMKLAWKCRKLPSRWTPTTGKRVRDPEIWPVNDDETLPETKKKVDGWKTWANFVFFFPAIFRGVCC